MSDFKPSHKNLLNFLSGKPTSSYPVWFLRQAGRYLPEYQKLRSSMSFLELCNNTKKAAEVTLMPLRRFDLDAAIIFSDILILPQALGLDLSFAKDHGPRLTPVVTPETDLKALKIAGIEEKFSSLCETIQMVAMQLDTHVSLVGFAGAPYTLASYMIEGMTSKSFVKTKSMAFCYPQFFAKLMDILVVCIKKLLILQKQAGADVLMLFDSWAGSLHPDDYRTFVLPSMKKLFNELKAELACPIIYYPGQNPQILEIVKDISVDVVAVDWRYPLEKYCNELQNFFVQGNLDPSYLFAPKNFVKEKVLQLLDISEKYYPNRHIFNVGHGIMPCTPVDSLTTVVDTIRSYTFKN